MTKIPIVRVTNNEVLGWMVEKVLCDIYNVVMTTERGSRTTYFETHPELAKLLNDFANFWRSTVKESIDIVAHVASKGNPADFVLADGKFVNLKTNGKKTAMCAPNARNGLVCQPSCKTFRDTWMKQLALENTIGVKLSDIIYDNHANITETIINHFLSDHCLIHFHSAEGILTICNNRSCNSVHFKGTFVVNKSKQQFRQSLKIFFQNEDDNIKKSVAELQIHTNRGLKFRVEAMNVFKLVELGYISGIDSIQRFKLPNKFVIKTPKRVQTTSLISDSVKVDTMPRMIPLSIDYIGSKTRLQNDLLKGMLSVIGVESLKGLSFIDAMSGSGAISKMAIEQGCSKVLSNDIMEVGRLSATCLTANGIDVQKVQAMTTRITKILDCIDPQTDFERNDDNFWICKYLSGQHHADGTPLFSKQSNVLDKERLYFTKMNGYKIDVARMLIDTLFKFAFINVKERDHLVFSVVLAASKVGNVSAQWGAYLNVFKLAAMKPLQMELVIPPSTQVEHQVQNLDVIELLKSVETSQYDILYCDPPYNTRRYDKNYHILNYIAQYTGVKFKHDTKTAIPVESDNANVRFCSKPAVIKNLNDMLSLTKCKYFFLSYNNESLLEKSKVLEIIKKYYKESGVVEISHKRFKAQKKTKSNDTIEYLFYGKERKKHAKPNNDTPIDST